MTATDRFFHLDWLGSTRFLSDSSGNNFPQALRFDAYGNRSATQDLADYHATDLQFAGGWGYQTEWSSATDPGLGLQYLEQRYYDPAVGRFITPDPIGFAGGLNLYQYCGNDPINYVDPSGEVLVPLVVVGIIVLLDLSAKPADIPAPGLVNDPASCQVARAYAEMTAPLQYGYRGQRPDLLEMSGQPPGGAPIRGPRQRRVQHNPSARQTTPPTLPGTLVYQKGEVRFQHYYGTIENDHGPAHVHVRGGGPNTRIRHGGGPVDDTDLAMTRTKQRAYEEGKSTIKPRINRIGRWLQWMARFGGRR